MKNNKNWLTKINHFTLLYSKHTKTRHVCPTVTWFVYTLHTGSKQRRRLTYIEILQHLSHFMGKFIQTVLKVKQIKTDFTNKTHYINITETLLNLTWWQFPFLSIFHIAGLELFKLPNLNKMPQNSTKLLVPRKATSHQRQNKLI